MGHTLAPVAFGDDDLLQVGRLGALADLVVDPADDVRALVDGHEVLVLHAEAHVELGGEEQPQQALDLLGVERVAHAVDVTVLVLERDDDVALPAAAEVGPDEVRLRPPGAGAGRTGGPGSTRRRAPAPVRRAARRRHRSMSSVERPPSRIRRGSAASSPWARAAQQSRKTVSR